ncbi:unnamed protein product, partial [Hydatigera taeniaeformis]|uniref:Uncharacterized protein n=1 Tax=Hydatigena taeniaeformis TaxID=6205 RepID=A0A0R3WY20_HYDTA
MDGETSTPWCDDVSCSGFNGRTYADEVFMGESQSGSSFLSPKHSHAVWKRRRRAYFDPSTTNEGKEVRALGRRLSLLDSPMRAYMDFRLAFGEEMAMSSHILASRRRLSKNISASPSTLFGPSESDVPVSVSKKKQHEDVVNGLNERCYMSLFERVIAEVERFVMCGEATPPLVQAALSNRFLGVGCEDKAANLDLVDQTF